MLPNLSTVLSVDSSLIKLSIDSFSLVQLKARIIQERQVPTLPLVVVSDVPRNAAEATGVVGNAAGDGAAFVSALIINVATIAFFICIFNYLRKRYRGTYANNIRDGSAPTKFLGSNTEEALKAVETMWGWARASLNTSVEEVAETTGLDQAMFLQYCNLCMRILKLIGVPMICIIGPINCAFGGQPAWVIGDYLSSLSFGNIVTGSKLYWMHAFVVWYVVIVVQVNLHEAQKSFLKLRYKWLKSMPEVRANTLLIEGIPNEYRSDGKLKVFFTKIFGNEAVKSAFMVKDTATLSDLIKRRDASTQALAVAEARWANVNQDPNQRPMSYVHGDLINYYKNDILEVNPLINAERARVQKEMVHVGGVNTHCGFVTFTDTKWRQIASTQLFSSDLEEWVVSQPPEPVDLIWSDLQEDLTKQQGKHLLGIAAIVGLYFAYMPMVIGISQFCASLKMGPIWEAFAPTMGLLFMVSFLPTFLHLIADQFFVLKAEVWAQKRLQSAYFWFLIVFVVLVTAIGESIVEFTETLLTDPFGLPDLFANTMPHATHFYMNYLVLDWVTHFSNLTRMANIFKFWGAIALYEEEDALDLSEPEDQDYYGIGGRSARSAIMMVIAIVYGTLSPPINLLAWVDFACMRLCYGYLMPFAERKKADLGGAFWVECLSHLFIGNIIYCVVMIGVLHGRAGTEGFTPAIIVMPTLIYVFWSNRRFKYAFEWEELPISEVAEGINVKRRELRGTYEQPELK